MNVQLYPELANKSLAEVLRIHVNPGYENIAGFEETGGSKYWASMQGTNRRSDISIGIEERHIIANCWNLGVLLATARSNSFSIIGKVLSDWNYKQLNTADLLQQNRCVEIAQGATAYESGAEQYIDHLWKSMHAVDSPVLEHLSRVLELASTNPVLNRLTPYTSMNKLLFGEYTGYPFSENSPGIYSLDGKTYVVTFKQLVFVGLRAEEAIEKVLEILPSNYGPAKHGTASGE